MFIVPWARNGVQETTRMEEKRSNGHSTYISGRRVLERGTHDVSGRRCHAMSLS